jgi:hypothetical protein
MLLLPWLLTQFMIRKVEYRISKKIRNIYKQLFGLGADTDLKKL